MSWTANGLPYLDPYSETVFFKIGFLSWFKYENPSSPQYCNSNIAPVTFPSCYLSRFSLLAGPRPACAFNIGTISGSDWRSNIVGFTILAQHWDNIEMLPGLSSANAFGIFQKEQDVVKKNYWKRVFKNVWPKWY